MWGLGLIGAAVGIVGAALFWIQQAKFSGDNIWPLPALVLILWALLGITGMFGPIRAVQINSERWLEAAWAVDGALLPMAVLGGFSIGPMVLLTLLPLTGAAAIASWEIGARFIKYLGVFGIGAAAGLGVLLFLIIIGRGY